MRAEMTSAQAHSDYFYLLTMNLEGLLVFDNRVCDGGRVSHLLRVLKIHKCSSYIIHCTAAGF